MGRGSASGRKAGRLGFALELLAVMLDCHFQQSGLFRIRTHSGDALGKRANEASLANFGRKTDQAPGRPRSRLRPSPAPERNRVHDEWACAAHAPVSSVGGLASTDLRGQNRHLDDIALAAARLRRLEGTA